MGKMFCKILLLLTAFHVYSYSQNSFQAYIEDVALLHRMDKPVLTDLSQRQKLSSHKYIVQLYKKVANGTKRLPFGAQIVRSFSGIGKTSKTFATLDSNLRVPPNEEILYAMLHFCVQPRIPQDIFILKTKDMMTGRTVITVGSQLKHMKCLKVEVTSIIKERRKSKITKIPISLKLSIKAYNRLQNRTSWLYWNSRLSQLKEIIVFSKKAKAVPSFLGLHTIEHLRRVKRRDSSEENNVTGKKGCYKKKLIVNFASLGYSNIIAPTIFDAGQCIGQCKYPLGKTSNPTQHSLIQQLLHSLYGERVAKSTCCSPRGFRPLTTMIDDKYSGRIAIKSLENMIVSECGCV